MKTTVVQYRVRSAEAAEENQRLVEDVFHELDALGRTGFTYLSLRLEDGLRFVHVVVEHDQDGVDLSQVPAFQRFLAGTEERFDGPPDAQGASFVGLHGTLPVV